MRKTLSSTAAAIAEMLGTLVRLVWLALPGLAGLVLVAYGAWLWWPPAGFVAAGALLLADQVWEQLRTGREER